MLHGYLICVKSEDVKFIAGGEGREGSFPHQAVMDNIVAVALTEGQQLVTLQLMASREA